MNDLIDPVHIVPSVADLHDFDQHILDADDVVHVLNPRRVKQSLCRHRWVDPWWQGDWAPQNYPACATCQTTAAAALLALGWRRGMCGTGAAASWSVVDRDDPAGAVHRLNALRTNSALCGWVWRNVESEGRDALGELCELCDLLAGAGVGKPGPGLTALSGPAPKAKNERVPDATKPAGGDVSKPAPRQRKPRRSSAARREAQLRKQRANAKKARDAARADRTSAQGHGYCVPRVRVVSGGLPGLGKRR